MVSALYLSTCAFLTDGKNNATKFSKPLKTFSKLISVLFEKLLLATLLSEIDYSRYKKFYLFIDNDDVSNNIKLQILEKYPQFEPINMNCGCKDFNEHYLKCIKGRK